jgi:hypothetical protein
MLLVIVMMALTLLTGLGTSLVVGTMTETAVAAAYRQGIETFYAADAAVEFAIRDLAARSDWDEVLSGERSALVDGPPDGTRQVGAAVVDLVRGTAEVDAILAARTTPPSASAQLYAYGRFDGLLPAAAMRAPTYVCVWVAELAPDEETEPEVPAVRRLYVVGRAYGPTGGRRTVLVTVARRLDQDEMPPLEVRTWEEPQ